MSDADDAFVRYKSRPVVSWTLANSRRLHERPCAMKMANSLAGRSVVIVGAGYSLIRSQHLLQTVAKGGAAIVAVNAADPVLRKLNITPDVLVIRESIDHADTVAASKAPLIVADAGVHPNTWEAAGERLAWFLPGYPHTMQICQRLGVIPLFGGSAALTSAVALAIEPPEKGGWGAASITLIGVDLAWTRDGDRWLSYHPDAPRGDLSATVHETADGLMIEQSGNVADDERTVRSGQRAHPKRVRAQWVTPWDWGPPVVTIDTLTDQRQWLETQARRHGERVWLENASRGAGIAGWRHAEEFRDRDHHDEQPTFERVFPVDRGMNQNLVLDLDEAAERFSGLCDTMLSARGPNLKTFHQHVAAWAPLPEALAAWRIIDGPTAPLERLRHTYSSMRTAAAEARAILNGGTL